MTVPYDSVDDLPDAVKDNLPAGAQKIWKNAYNQADGNKEDFPSAADRAQYAWGAVKKAYEKDAEGKWMKKKTSLEGYTNDEFTMAMPTDPSGWARLYFGITPKAWGVLDAAKQQEFIGQIPVSLSSTFVRLTSLSMSLDVYSIPEESSMEDLENRIEWIRDDISSLWSRLWSDKEKTEVEFGAINKRIDDLIAIFSGTRTLAESNLSAELTKLGQRLLDFDISVMNDGVDIDNQISWMQEDISYLWNEVYTNRDMAETQVETINKRIDDLITVFTGVKRLSSREISTEEPWQVHCSETGLEWERVGDLLKIKGTLIAEGTWTGLDGQTVFYPGTIFEEAAPGILHAAIKRGHKMDDDSVIGFVTASVTHDKEIKIEGIIFDKESIEDVVTGELGGISMEADVHAEMDDAKGCFVATSMGLRKATLVKNPACAPCKIDTASAVSLEGQERNKEKKIMAKYKLYAKPTEVEFFTYLGQQLKNAGLDAGVTDGVVSAMRDAVEMPEIEPTGSGTELTDLQTGFDELKVKFDEMEGNFNTKTSELEAKETELTEKTAEATELSEALGTIKKAEVAALASRIKEIDKDFNEVEMLEGIECPDAQKAQLTRYLGFAVKLAAKAGITVDTKSGSKDAVGKVLLSMGITDVKKFIEGK